MKLLTEGLRWKLILGCLVLAVLEGPDAGQLLVQDLAGPYRAEARVDPIAVDVAPVRGDPVHLAALTRSSPSPRDSSEHRLDLERRTPTVDAPDVPGAPAGPFGTIGSR